MPISAATGAESIKLYADIKDLTAARLRSDLGYLPAVVVGSPPCQDASVANAGGQGVDGERTGLFFEAVRLVDEIRPVWACFENVPGLRTRGADRVLAALESLGYACWPLVVGARHAGAPHRRNRVWIVAADLDAASQPMGIAGQPRSAGLGTAADTAIRQARSRPDISLTEPRNDAAADAPIGNRPAHAPRCITSATRMAAWHRSVIDCAGTTAADADRRRQPQLKERHCEPLVGFDSSLRHDAFGFHAAADASGTELRQQPRRRSGPDWSDTPISRIADAWRSWGEPVAEHLRLDDGIPAGLARQCVSAYGDAVVPQITEAIGRAMSTLVPTDGTVLDLFCGAAGGWSLGLHRAGYRTVAACEIDDWRRSTFAAAAGRKA